MSQSDEDPKLDKVKAVLRRLQQFPDDAESAGHDWSKPEPRRERPIAPPLADMVAADRPVAVTALKPTASAGVVALSSGPQSATAPANAVAAIGTVPPTGRDGHGRAGVVWPAVASGLAGMAVGGLGIAWMMGWLGGSALDRARPVTAAHAPAVTAAIPAAPARPPTRVPVAPASSDTQTSSQPIAAVPVATSAPAQSVLPPLGEVLKSAGEMLEAGRIGDARALLLARSSEPSPEVAMMLARSYDPTVLSALAQADAKPSPEEASRWYRVWHERALAQGLVSDTSAIDRLLRSIR